MHKIYKVFMLFSLCVLIGMVVNVYIRAHDKGGNIIIGLLSMQHFRTCEVTMFDKFKEILITNLTCTIEARLGKPFTH